MIHASSVAVSREHRRAKTDRLDTDQDNGLLKNGGTLEKAAAMANHASARRTQLYDRRGDELSLDEVERS